MKKIILAVLILSLVFISLACSNTAATSSQSSEQSGGVGGAAAISSAGTSSAASASASAKTGPISPLTGEPGVGDYRPVQVQIDNEATGRPQTGIQSADIPVYIFK